LDFLIIPILLVAFTLRILPRFRIKYAYTGDTYAHMYLARVIRENNFRIPSKIPGVILDHSHTYPYLYHLLLSFFNERSRAQFERISSALFDSISILILYFFADWLSNHYEIVNSSYLGLWLAILLAFSPPLLMVSRGPRAYRGTPRVFGQTLYFLHITTFFYYFSSGNYFALIVSIFASALIFITAKFGVQVLVLFGIFFSIFFTPAYLLYLALAYTLAYIISSGRVLKVTEGQIRYNEFYVQLMKTKGTLKGFVSDWLELKVFLARLKRNFLSALKGNLSSFLSWIFSERYFVYFLIIAFPQIIFLIFVLNDIALDITLRVFLITWFSASLFWFILTSFNYLRFLGQGERYLEYGLPASLLLSLFYLMENGLEYIIVGFLAYSVIVYVIHFKIFINNNRVRNDNYHADQKVFDFLKSQKKGIVLPIHNEWETLYKTQFPMLFYGSNIDLRKISIKEFNSIYHNMHSPGANLHELVERFNVKYIISSHAHLKEYVDEVLGNSTLFNDITEKLVESNNFILFKIKNK
jgi:hypothetical protein